MCGIFGASGKPDSGTIVALGCQLESRGTDSSGLAWIDHMKKSILVSKVVERGSVAFPLLLKDDVEKASNSSCVIGHTRMASTGKVNIKNAHPFYIDNVVFAHNGVISNYQTFGRDKTCDSMCLIKGIKERNFEPFNGSIALVWIENGKLHAYRKGNPLFRGKKKDAIYLASEKSMLARVGCKKIKELTEGMVYAFDKTSIVDTTKVKENTCNYSVGTQEKWWKEYENNSDWEWGDISAEEKAIDAGLDYYEKDGKLCYGKVKKTEQEYLDKMFKKTLDEKDTELDELNSDMPIHRMTDREWNRYKKYGGV